MPRSNSQHYIIKCSVCKSDVDTIRRNTKYCLFHRVYNGRLYVMRIGKQTTCKFCKTKFLASPANVMVCSECYPPPDSNGRGKCGICKMPDRIYLNPGVKICGSCMESVDPATVDAVNDNLRIKHNELVKNPAKLDPDDEPGETTPI